ncbi:uncharacterized protein LOC117412456 [Acipenser ruthenus]|uniref:uncharacterized protein LOC117412456 n=1 Tax=Acipenser ruthenus TaxID=7906 RepID=UPI00274040F6|nr:uncharacterized protein LOC117412456 [Acipenser ruthenus]
MHSSSLRHGMLSTSKRDLEIYRSSLSLVKSTDEQTRLFSLWEERRRLALLAEWFHHQRCVLKVTSFTHWPGQQQESRRVFLCSAATDGSIAFWDITEAVEGGSLEEDGGAPQRKGLGSPFLTVRLHQSGVNSLDILETETPGRYLLASGGDDGSLQQGAVLVKSQDRLKVPRFPVIRIRTEQTAEKASSKQVSFPARSASQPPQRPSQGRRRKCVPVLSVEMSPWGGPSFSESSFTTIPPPPPREEREKDRVPPAGQDTGSRGRAPRKPPLRPRLHTARLPHLRSVSNLSFSRSFTFSFFELPEHQTLQHRLERQREVHLLLRELQL